MAKKSPIQGSFLEHNTYALRDHVPWYVAFVVGGDLAGRADPFFDSSLEISPELLTEWRRFHKTRRDGVSPVVAVHFPLDGEQLLRAMAWLGLGSHTLARGTAAYLSTLARVAPYRECYLPMPLLTAIEAGAAALPPFPLEGRQQQARGAWLSSKPQSQWSRWHTAVDGKEGYLWYAPVYAAEDGAWDTTVDVRGFRPTPQPPPTFSGLADWLRGLRAHGLRVVPVLAATETDEKTRALAERSQEEEEPRGLVYQNAGDEADAAPVPMGWWELSTGSSSELRLETH
jgi:hypothetical protein